MFLRALYVPLASVQRRQPRFYGSAQRLDLRWTADATERVLQAERPHVDSRGLRFTGLAQQINRHTPKTEDGDAN